MYTVQDHTLQKQIQAMNFFLNQVGCNKYAIKFHYNNTYTIRCKVNHSIINVQCVLTFIHSNRDPKYDLKVVAYTSQ